MSNSKNLILSDCASIIFSFHKNIDKIREERKGVNKIGTTSITIDITTLVTRKNNILGKDQAIMVTEGKFVYVSIDSKGKPIKIQN